MPVLSQLLSLLIPAILGLLLGRKLGIAYALLAGSLLAAWCSWLGGWLLKQVAVNELSWKNRVAGWLLPWGYRLFPDSLTGIRTVSAMVFASAFVMGLVLDHELVGKTWDASSGNGLASISLLLAAWIANGGVFLYMLNQFGKYGGSKALVIAMLFPMCSVALSWSCLRSGQMGWALGLSAGPLLVVAVAYGLFAAVILLAGKTARWN